MWLSFKKCFGLLLAAAMVPCLWAQEADNTPHRVLIFHKQNGYIHTATQDVVNLLKNDFEQNEMEVETTTDSLQFNEENLSRFAVVVFINTNYRNGALLNSEQEQAFEDYLHNGGAFAGIHSAVPLNGAWEESVWPWYADLFGARFKSHPPMRVAPFRVEDAEHPSTENLPQSFNLNDEWYAVQVNPREDSSVHVLATVDETGFPAGSGMDGDHPVSWYRYFEGARTFITLVGHDMSTFSDGNLTAHIRGGVVWAGAFNEEPDSTSTPVQFETQKQNLAAGYEGIFVNLQKGKINIWKKGPEANSLELRVDGKSIANLKGLPKQH